MKAMKKIERLIVYPLLVAVFVFLTIFDLGVSQALHSPSNLFGKLGEAVTVASCLLLCVFAFVILFRFGGKRAKRRMTLFDIAVTFVHPRLLTKKEAEAEQQA